MSVEKYLKGFHMITRMLMTLLICTLMSCIETTSSQESTNNNENVIPSEFLGQWRIIRYWQQNYENTDKEISEVATEARMADYKPLYNTNSEQASIFFTLLFTTNDSLVIFGTHCSGENTGNPRYVYPFTWEDGLLMGDSLTSEFTIGDGEITADVTYLTSMKLENGNVIIEQSQVYLIPSKNLRQVIYQKTEYERYSQAVWTIDSKGTCTSFSQQMMPLPVF